MRYQDPQVCELLAAEYVLGTLKGPARRRFEGLLHARPDLRHRVREWEFRLSQVMGQAPAAPPPPEVWDALQRRLFLATPPACWYERLAFWRSLALGSGLLAGILAVLLIVAPLGETPGYVVILKDPAQQPVWLISTAMDMSEFHIKTVKPMEVPPGKRCMLWLKPKGSEETYLLGAIPDQGEMVLRIDKDMRPMLPDQLLVTLEAMDSKSPPKPTGPPLFESEWLPVKKV